MTETVSVAADALQDFAARLLQAADVDADEARIVAASLVDSNLRGHDSHGVTRIPGYVEQIRTGGLVSGAELKPISETQSLFCADAGFGFGMVQTVRLIERLAPKAREHGVACGTLQNSGHLGRLGEWVERVARDGLAALLAVQDNGVLQCVAPPGGTQPRISTNPIAIGVPTGGEPLVLDMSTSVVANGKIFVAQSAGRQCPPGWLQDANGRPTTDPTVRFSDPRGTILPMGDYKGFGLGLLFDILIGGLSGGFCPPQRPEAKNTNNVLLVIWDPDKFSGQAHLLTQADELIAYVRATNRKPGVDSIRLPNERGTKLRQQRREQGVPLDHGTWKSLGALASDLKVDVPVV